MKTFSLPQFNRELQQHLNAHPLAQPADLVKYCRQRAFGTSRRYSDEQEALQALAGEYASLVPNDGAPLLEQLGPDTVRLDLAGAAARGLTPAQLARACVLDSRLSQPDREWFARSLDALEELAGRNTLPPACCRGMREFLARYREKGCPPLRHSEVYRNAYRPHYRVFTGPLARLVPLMTAVSQHAVALPDNRRLAVALEGSCGAGKTEAAGWPKFLTPVWCTCTTSFCRLICAPATGGASPGATSTTSGFPFRWRPGCPGGSPFPTSGSTACA